ncbi:MAG: peptidoglycan-binding protein [Bryobacteraceae bacterium]|jgi:peptidoglycan hydrolase-like protein with peptidoglycan-binding domain|nr:peptidoglycan-binding protein [Bryobacteraceae bacterium]
MSFNSLPPIKNGSTGLAVAYCQNLLNARLPTQPVLWVDGIFGMKTESRVRQYQMLKRLQVDGVVGYETWTSLEAGPPKIMKRPSPAIQVPATAGF